ncbi:hypothetical protein Pcinc_014985 [Petrolisthes cinctipes]|uniref:CUE domain-containing protein n=1 Tax=Petrolisthes cinctipes TaxID=88211 RepID=A0AAE1FVU1_PETCI|nr:hypothetical protein Pcinc_014985 [Petrolisthes cinctipes]
MSNTGAIPKGGARPKIVDLKRDNITSEKLKGEIEVINEPLDQKFIPVNRDGAEKRVPALHKGWAQRGTYIKYNRPPVPDDGGLLPVGAQEAWIEMMEFLRNDLSSVLTLPHHRFWSQVVYDPGLHESLESYLSRCHRWYEMDNLEDYARHIVESVHQLVFLVYVRMATHKESKTCHITPSVFGDIIYENYVFDICKLFDLCAVYGLTNSQLLSQMLSNIFKHQPNYYSDLVEAVPSVRNALEKIEDKLGVSEHTIIFPVALGTSSSNMSLAEIEDIVNFLLDTFFSLQMFLSLHPPAAKYFSDDNFDIKISVFYERVFPALMSELSECDAMYEPEPTLVKKIELTRSLLLVGFRSLLHHKCLTALQADSMSTTVVGECLENYMNIMSTCAGEKTFIADYCSAYSVKDDVELFQKHGGDTTMLSFVKDVVATAVNDLGLSSNVENLTLSNPPSSTLPVESTSDGSGMNGYGSVPGDVELASMVSSVQDLLPHLGAGFIHQCLKYYSYSTEEVINALLVENLPPSLSTLDRSAPLDERPSPRPSSPSPSEASLPPNTTENGQSKGEEKHEIMDRANVYANDEFDVFSNVQVDRSKIHKGKMAKKLVNDEENKETVEKLKEIARQYDERGGTSIYEDEFRYEEESYRPYEYDDEYDDTYDDNEAGNIDEFSAEKVKRRPGIIGAGRLNTHIEYAYAQESSEEKSDAEVEEGSKEESANNLVHSTNRPKNRVSTRGVQRIIKNTSSKPKRPSPELNHTNERDPQEEADVTLPSHKTEMKPFCENPEDVRRRAEQRRQDREAHRRKGNWWRGEGGRDGASLSNGVDGARPKIAHSSTKHSGKSWRQGEGNGGGGGGGNEERGYRGGKYKEDTNHGQAQSRQYRYKMMHKNDHKRQGAQAKFNRNN